MITCENLIIINLIVFHQSEDGAKRQKLSDGSSALAANVPQLGGIRRSTRHRKLRGEKALIVSANQTLKELKIQVQTKKPSTQQETHSYLCLMLQIMHAFSVAPFDQNLSIDGKGLTDDSATLGSLGVVPESIICLKVTTAKLAPASRRRRGSEIASNSSVFPQADEPVSDYAAMDDVYQGECCNSCVHTLVLRC